MHQCRVNVELPTKIIHFNSTRLSALGLTHFVYNEYIVSLKHFNFFTKHYFKQYLFLEVMFSFLRIFPDKIFLPHPTFFPHHALFFSHHAFLFPHHTFFFCQLTRSAKKTPVASTVSTRVSIVNTTSIFCKGNFEMFVAVMIPD